MGPDQLLVVLVSFSTVVADTWARSLRSIVPAVRVRVVRLNSNNAQRQEASLEAFLEANNSECIVLVAHGKAARTCVQYALNLPIGPKALVLAEATLRDVGGDAGRVDCPVLVIRGRQSTVLSHSEAVAEREAFVKAKKTRIVELEHTGNLPFSQRPHEFAEAVVWFLDSVGCAL